MWLVSLEAVRGRGSYSEAVFVMNSSQGRPGRAVSGAGLLASLIVAFALLVAAQPATVKGQSLVTGITFLDSYEPIALRHARESGAKLTLVVASWPQIAPKTEPGSWRPEDPTDPAYDWTSTDTAVAEVVKAGLTPMVLIQDVPEWASRCRSGRACDPGPEDLRAFAVAAARRYSGALPGLPRVRYWQGLNEPNLSLFFNPQFKGGKPVSPVLYRKLINAFYDGIKSVSQSNLVLAAGLGPIARPRFTIGPMRFAREMLCMRGRHKPQPAPGDCEGGVHFDIFDIHPYTTGGPTHKGHVDDVEMGDLGKLQELIRAADRAGRIKGRFRRTPLWITEFSWDSKPPDPGGLPMPILKRWTAEALYRAWSAGVSHFFWLALTDNPPDPSSPFSETIEAGLYFRGATVAEDQPKPNMYAFRFPFVAYTSKSGFTYWGRTGTSEGGRVAIQVQEHGHWRNAAVARANRSGIFQGAVTTTYGRGKHGMVRALYRGEEAVPFSLHPVKDFYQAPFGNPVG